MTNTKQKTPEENKIITLDFDLNQSKKDFENLIEEMRIIYEKEQN